MDSVLEEIWKDIPGLPYFQASNLGNIRTLEKPYLWNEKYPGKRKAGLCSKTMKHNGYEKVKIRKKTLAVHRLVAMAFIGPIPKGMQINHKNSIRNDNRLENLEIVTPQENILHAIRVGRIQRKGESNPRSSITVDMVRQIRLLHSSGMRVADIARKFGIINTQVCKIWKRVTWGHVD